MNEVTRIAIDTSKAVFTLHGVDGEGRAVLRRNLRRPGMLAFFEKLPAVEVVLEACGASHYWGRSLAALGHRVRLIPAQYVKPFVKRGKNDRNDAEAIGWPQPGRACSVGEVGRNQARAMLLTVRELLVRQRTQLVNALRGHAAEIGLVAPLGTRGWRTAGEIVSAADTAGPAAAGVAMLGKEIDRLEARLATIDGNLLCQYRADPVSRRLAGVPGVGPISALNFACAGRRRSSGRGGTSLPGSAWCHGSARPAASSVWAASVAPATSGCASFWCSVPPQ